MVGSNFRVFSFAGSGTKLYARTGYGVSLSSDDGASWTDVSTGLTGKYLNTNTLALSGTHLFVGTQLGVWKRPLSEMVNSVERVGNATPTLYHLDQNYPNPFNPSTTFAFSLPSRSFVTLKIYDVTGRDVSTILSKEMTAGNYSMQWNASGLPSGVYFYRLQAGSYSGVKCLMLVK